MTDTLRNMPRYIRNTDAFGWQGADGPDGPWRPIAPPQSGAPWQTTDPMDDLRQASAEVSGIAVLSPAAQAVLDAYANRAKRDLHGRWVEPAIAAALRAVAAGHSENLYDQNEGKVAVVRSDLVLAIATELEDQ